MKNCIRSPYEKPLKSGFIENSNFENNRDPCLSWYLVNHHVQKILNTSGKGGLRASKAELRTAKFDPYFERKNKTKMG